MRIPKPILAVLLSVLLFSAERLLAQTTVFSENFEGAVSAWQVAGPIAPNTWIRNTCAGNGITQTGTQSAYISSGGTVPGCGPAGVDHYGYDNAAAGSNAVVYHRNVNNLCFSAMELSFDVQIDGAAAEDYLEVVYSTDNGATWVPVSGQLTGAATWQNMSFPLPALLDYTSFRIGFRFTYNDATVNGNPPAIDNVLLEGTTTDATNPTAVCPASVNVYANASCEATVPDLPPSVTKSDNCTAASDLLVQQSPAILSTITATTMATVTVTDQAGNQATCNTNLLFVDTISPVVTCPATQTGVADNNCEYALTDMTGMLVATDNCTASGSLTFSQSPVAGTALTMGDNTITLTAEDAAGNTQSCPFTLTVDDTTAPVVTCPTYHLVTANELCIAHVGDLSGVPVSVTDNCTTNPNLLAYSQVPAAIMTFSDTIAATIYVSDASGNIGQCQLSIVAADTVAPTVTCLSDTTVFTTNPCNYFVPNLNAAYVANDACTPTDLTFSQAPPAGSPSSGLTVVTTTITDAYGNSSVCYTNVHPVDIAPATVTCPGNQSIDNGLACFYTISDYTGMVTVTDNCSGYTLTQSPPATTVVPAGTNVITMTVTDAGNNTSTCTFNLDIIETVMPSIACPPNITSCDTLVTYATPDGTDNCLYVITQTDASGLTSGSFFPPGLTTQTWTITDSSGNTASCSFTVEVLEIPDPAVIAEDTIEMCNTFTTPVSATAVGSGTGSWSVIQGSGTFVDANAAATTVNALGVGTNKLMWSVTSPSCGTKTDTLIVVVWPLPTVAQVQDTLVTCTETGVLLQGSFPTNGIGTWTSSSGIVFEDEHAAVTGISNLNGGTHTVAWTISSGICPISSDTMVVVLPNIASVNFPADTTLCESYFPIQLQGSEPSAEQNVVWSTLIGETSFTNNYSASTTLTGASVGTVQIVYWLTHAACGNSTDTITFTVQDCGSIITGIPTLFTPNADSKNDYFDIPNLGLNYPACRVEIYNRWGGLIFESDGYTDLWDGTYKGEDVPIGTYFYHIWLNDDADTKIDGSISIIR